MDCGFNVDDLRCSSGPAVLKQYCSFQLTDYIKVKERAVWLQ